MTARSGEEAGGAAAQFPQHPAGSGLQEHDDLRWPFIRQRFQENRVNQVENRAIGADAQRQDESRAREKQRRSPEYAAGVGDIAQEIFEQPEGEQIPTLLLDSCRAAKLTGGGYAGLAGVQPLSDELVRQALDMEFDLIADIVAAEQGAEPEFELSKHLRPPSGWRKWRRRWSSSVRFPA
jgi:hypothetical protein